MTRFARARGSKASNKRTPEEATSWGEMKQQLLDKTKQAEENQMRLEAEKQRQANYQSFLGEQREKEETKTKWAEFPVESVNNTQKSSTKKGIKDVISKAKRPRKKLKTDQTKPVTNAPVKKDLSKLTEVEKKKIEHKKQKFLRQKEKRKLKKAQQQAENQNQNKTTNSEDIEGSNEVSEQNKPFNKIDKPVNNNSNQKSKSSGNNSNFKKNPRIQKKDKFANSKKPERRKNLHEKMVINGKEVDIAYVDGFPVKAEDAVRIKQLKQDMIKKGLPRSEIQITLKLERRKAEKAFAREKKKVCFKCRQSGHNLSECPQLETSEELVSTGGTGICYKCGSTEHTHFQCKIVRQSDFRFAKCFVCNEIGHISRQCPDNARGLYPHGGACRMCGDVTHLKKDCPQYQAQKQQNKEHAETGFGGDLNVLDGGNPESFMGERDESGVGVNKSVQRPNKIIKF